MKLIFLHADKHHQSLLQVDFNNMGINVSYMVILSLFMGMIHYFHGTQSNKFVISLQYLKKKLATELFNKNVVTKFYTCNKILGVATAFVLYCDV